MKYFILILTATAFAFMFSCSNDVVTNEPNPLPDNAIITLVRDVELPGMTTRSETPTITVVFDDNTETILSYEVSQSILDHIGMTAAELDEYLKQEMGGLYYLREGFTTRNPELPEGYTHSQCMEYCRQTFTDENGEKIKGRGGCKANCWIDTVIKIIEAPFAWI